MAWVGLLPTVTTIGWWRVVAITVAVALSLTDNQPGADDEPETS